MYVCEVLRETVDIDTVLKKVEYNQEYAAFYLFLWMFTKNELFGLRFLCVQIKQSIAALLLIFIHN